MISSGRIIYNACRKRKKDIPKTNGTHAFETKWDRYETKGYFPGGLLRCPFICISDVYIFYCIQSIILINKNTAYYLVFSLPLTLGNSQCLQPGIELSFPPQFQPSCSTRLLLHKGKFRLPYVLHAACMQCVPVNNLEKAEWFWCQQGAAILNRT